MGVQIATLRVDMTDGELGADGDVRKRVRHSASSERVLELRAHEPVAVARAAEDHEVDLEHAHVEEDGDDDQAECAGNKVAQPDARGDAEVAEEDPQLIDGAEADGGDSEEADPLAAEGRTERHTGHEEEDPPRLGEGLVLVFVGKADPEEDGERGEEDEGRVEEDVSGLGDETILESD